MKLLFNSLVFLFAGIISAVRLESLEIIISLLFSSLFLLLNILMKEEKSKSAIGQTE
ncbi:MAG: hypothetical protein ACYDA4_06690 [Ignavibacteriaceae bacterium]